jgi:hypothetical protein
MIKKIGGKIYLATNTHNGKQYVGLTTRPLSTRVKGHISSALKGKGSEYSLQAAIREHGSKSITFKIIDTAETEEDLSEKEILYIKQYDTLTPNGYNLNRGGAIGQGGEIYEVEGEEYFGLAKVADAYGILEITMHKRMQSGTWTLEQACGIEPPPEIEQLGLKIALDGMEFLSISKACEFYKIDKRIIDMRINRMGWSLEEAFILKERNTHQFDLLGQKFPNFRSACEYFGLNNKKVESRIRMGWSLEQAFDLEVRPIKLIKCGGEEFKTYREVAERYQIRHELLRGRVSRGWTVEEAVGLEKRPPRQTSSGPMPVVVDGQKFKSRADACRFYGVDESLIRSRLKRGLTLEESFEVVATPKKSEVKEVKVGKVTYKSISEAALAHKIKVGTLNYRLCSGWTIEQALGLETPPHNNLNHQVIKVGDMTFPSRKAAADYYDVNISNVRYRIKKGWNLRQCFELDPPPTKSVFHYVVTNPIGEEFLVDDFSSFARKHKMPKDGMTLRSTLYSEKNHTWRGWKIRKADV